MAIYRGPGGSGDAVNDSSSEARLAVEARDAAIAAQAAAEAAQAAAETAETNAELAETNAETAETNAETAEANAETAEANAEAAQAAAEVAQAAAEAAQTAAELAETNAETAETNAETAASLAQDWATKLSTPVSGSDYSAKYNANLAAASASAAQTAETNAETAQAAAEAARDAALSAYDNFDDRYLGPKSSDPTLDNDGNALLTGALYFNTTSSVMKVYTGSAWVAAYVSAAGVLLTANNLSDVANAATARTNLGVAIGTNVQAWDADLDTWSTKTAPSGTVVGTSDSQTLTNKTIALGSNTVSGTLAEFNTAVTDADLVSIAGTETLTNKTLTSPTISGGSINNATVGASTASTGAFTTLSASGAFSANGGATLGDASGDALTINSSAVSIPNGLNFDSNTLVIDATNNRVGVGTASPSNKLSVYGADVEIGNGLNDGKLTVGSFVGTGSQTDIKSGGFTTFTTYSGGAFYERMRIDSSGNVGIGTSSPSARLDVSGGSIRVNEDGAGTKVIQIRSNWAGVDPAINVQTNNPLLFATNGTERMRIDSSGNVGIGTSSPSSYNAVARQLVISNSSSATGMTIRAGGGGAANIVFSNAEDTGVDGLIQYDTASNFMRFDSNGTERMRIDSSGNLGIGTTSVDGAGTKFQVKGSGSATATVTATSSDGGCNLTLYSGASSADNGAIVYTNGLRFANGTPSTSSFTERMRIDSSGNLLVGKTSFSGTSGNGYQCNSTGNVNVVTASSTNSFTTYELYSTGAGAYRFYVGASGTIFATSTSISAISDQRLKENVRPLDLGLSEVMALQPRRFDWKEGKGQDKKDAVGFIAQEFETVLPDSVGTSKAGEDGIEYKNINYEELVPTLVKAIQEQQVLIQSQADTITAMEARLTALENK